MIMTLWTRIDLLCKIVISSEWSQTRTIRLFLDNFRFKNNIFVYKMKDKDKAMSSLLWKNLI